MQPTLGHAQYKWPGFNNAYKAAMQGFAKMSAEDDKKDAGTAVHLSPVGLFLTLPSLLHALMPS